MITAEGRVAGAGGGQVFWRSWCPSGAEPRAVVVIAHGLAEHGGRYGEVATCLVEQGYAVYAHDHQGHGRSDGPRARVVLAQTVADLDRMVDTVLARHGETPVFLLGHSMGGAIALRYAAAHQDRLAGLCPPSGSMMLAERLGCSDLTVVPFEGLYHEILNEPERAQVLEVLCGWLAARVRARATAGP